jgi:acyl-CoA synthetase (AMP-forming)/AMP-acid ligase II
MIKEIITAHVTDYHLRDDDFRYVAAPAFQITGICGLLAGVWYGSTSLILPQFSVKELMPILQKDQLTGMFLVPTMMSMLLQREEVTDLPFRNLRLIYYGASPMSPTLLRHAMDVFGCEFLRENKSATDSELREHCA